MSSATFILMHKSAASKPRRAGGALEFSARPVTTPARHDLQPVDYVPLPLRSRTSCASRVGSDEHLRQAGFLLSK